MTDEYEPTYRIVVINGRPAIACLLCDSLSTLQGDVDNRYCARCKVFHEDLAEARLMLLGDQYVIWSIEHGAWWRPGRMGYTERLDEAGSYARDEAADILRSANFVKTNECAIPRRALERGADAIAEPLALACPLCEWSTRVEAADVREVALKVSAFMARALVDHIQRAHPQ